MKGDNPKAGNLYGAKKPAVQQIREGEKRLGLPSTLTKTKVESDKQGRLFQTDAYADEMEGSWDLDKEASKPGSGVYPTHRAARQSLNEFTPEMRARHRIVPATRGGKKVGYMRQFTGKDPKAPGVRGGKFHRTKTGHVRYGDKKTLTRPEVERSKALDEAAKGRREAQRRQEQAKTLCPECKAPGGEHTSECSRSG